MRYSITASDFGGNEGINDNAGQYFVYAVILKFSPIVFLPIFIVATPLAGSIVRKYRSTGQ